MTLLGRDEALAAARRLVAASPADETEVTVESRAESFVRFADVGPTQSADRERVDVFVRARRRDGAGWREARARAGSLAERDLRAALERATLLAGHSPVDAEASPLAGAVEVAATSACAANLEHGFDAKAAVVARAVEACKAAALRPAGLVQTQVVSRALVNSAGREVHAWHNRARFTLTAGGEDASGLGESIARSVDDLESERAIERAVEKARRGAAPRALEPGEYTVVLEPAAVGALLLFMSYSGFGAREVHERSSFLCERIGTRALSEGLSIDDDAHDARFPGWPFDGEGTPRLRVPLVERGVLRDPVTDPLHARKLGLPCTGHAPPQPSAAGPKAENLVVATGTRSLEELIADVDRGLLVTQVHYANLIEPRDLTLTGTTRNGTFLIENGALVGGVRNLRFTDKLVGALGRVSGISSEAEVVGALFDGELLTPALRIDGFRFTSTSAQ